MRMKEKKVVRLSHTSARCHDTIECLVAALEANDAYTSGHSSRVADMTTDIARVLVVKGADFEDVHFAAHLHDVGKIAVPKYILNKPGDLLPHEWLQVKEHPVIGYNILCKSKLLYKVAKIVLYHHERWDGKGYPHGLGGNRIPLGARIIAVADAIDAMITQRLYREPLSWDECYHELQVNKEKQFDPTVIEAANLLKEKWIAVRTRKQLCLKDSAIDLPGV